MSDAYDRQLRKLTKDCADELGFDFVHEGVYLQQAGPAFETVGECRMMRLLDVDVVGACYSHVSEKNHKTYSIIGLCTIRYLIKYLLSKYIFDCACT